jgi:hypothetical protein
MHLGTKATLSPFYIYNTGVRINLRKSLKINTAETHKAHIFNKNKAQMQQATYDPFPSAK